MTRNDSFLGADINISRRGKSFSSSKHDDGSFLFKRWFWLILLPAAFVASQIYQTVSQQDDLLLWNDHHGTHQRATATPKEWIQNHLPSPNGRTISPACRFGPAGLWAMEETRSNSTDDNAPIPPNLLFYSGETNILKSKEPSELRQRVVETINMYRGRWKEDPDIKPHIKIRMLTDAQCQRYVYMAHADLALHFKKLLHFKIHRQELCQIAALYTDGGYFFDQQQVQSVRPLELLPNVKFVGVGKSPSVSAVLSDRRNDTQWLEPSFVAASAGHPILREALDAMLNTLESASTIDERAAISNLASKALQEGYDRTMEACGTEGIQWLHKSLTSTCQGVIRRGERVYFEETTESQFGGECQ